MRFVGRGPELDTLLAAAAGDGGDRSTWLVGGEAGVGKTRLIEELVKRVDPVVRSVSIGGCIRTAQGTLPFVAVTEALRALCRMRSSDEVAAAAGSVPELGVLLPEWVPHPPDRIAVAAEGSQLRLFAAVTNMLANLAATRPVCLVLEDLHWADPSTRDLLVYLVNNVSAPEVVIIGTYRSDEMARMHPFRPVLAELDRNPRVEHLLLEPFDTAELASFAAEILHERPTAMLLDEVVARSAGNAFFAAEILTAHLAGHRTVRPELSGLILARIESLSPTTQELLRLVAVGGESVRDELLGEVAGLADTDLISALREAIEHQVMTLSDDGNLRFRHALMQEAVYATLLPSERQRAHARFAHALTEAPELCGTDGVSAALAWHFREARQFERALEASIAAARSSELVLAFREALTHVEMALELWGDTSEAADLAGMSHFDLLRWAAELADAAGDYPRAVQYQMAAVDEGEDCPDVERGLLHVRLGRFLQSAGHAPVALEHYQTAVALVPEGPTQPRARVLAGYGQQLMLTQRSADAVSALREAIDIARTVADCEIEGHALNSLGSILVHNGRHDEGYAMLMRSLRIATDEDRPADRLRSYVNLTGGLTAAGNLPEAERIGREGVALADELGHGAGFGFFIAANLAEALSEMGRWDESDEVARQARRPEGKLPQTWLLHATVSGALRRGDLDEARRRLAEVDLDTINRVDPQIASPYWSGMVELSLATGDHQGCREAVAGGIESADPLDQRLLFRLFGIELEARAAEGDRDLDAAERHLGEMEHLVDEHLDAADVHSHRIHGYLAEARAMMAGLHGESETDRWWEAVSRWEAGAFAWHRARALLRLGSALLAEGDRAGALQALRQSVAGAEALGAEPLRAEAAQVLDHAGLVHTPGDTDHGVLTEREHAVLELVAEGRTNRQIGEALYISPKTASVHVSRILRKLGVENRTEAAAAARRAGLV